MKIRNILLLCLLMTNIKVVNATYKLNTNDTVEMQKLIKCLQSHKINLNWDKAEYLANSNNENQWQKLPTLGEIDKLSFCINSSKHSGSLKLPKAQYLELPNEYIEPCELIVRYKIETARLLRLTILDSFTDIDGLFSFKLYLKITDKCEGHAFGEIWIADSYKGKVRNIKFTLTPINK